jgi:hypothetical protein
MPLPPKQEQAQLDQQTNLLLEREIFELGENS